MITPTAFGRMCLKMIRELDAPARRAASTNSRSRSDRKSPRTSRAIPIQDTRPRKTARAAVLFAECATTAAAMSAGMMITMSVNRMMMPSVLPRKYPEHAPRTTPMKAAITPTTTRMNSEICVPRIVIANSSRPTRS